ncbi:MAG: hypothetical protein CM15mP60_3070 [Alphaproteobacteria bacterium]|nr:MAG: hypothetical protein CM15mP60_3070 [Alphaproteobacteria bacterium]
MQNRLGSGTHGPPHLHWYGYVGGRGLSVVELSGMGNGVKSPCHRGLVAGANRFQRQCFGEEYRRCFSIGGI